MDLNVKALEKLVDYAASGIGSVAGSMLAPWNARREAMARQIAAEGDANVLVIRAKAQAEARALLVSQETDVTGELDIADTVNQRIRFQERKRQINIASVVREAAGLLGEKEVPNQEPDHDWTARFFTDVQDVSSEEMQTLWSKILAGEVERAGSTSVRTLGILKNLDQATARLFRKFCSACMYLNPDGVGMRDARVPSLGGNAGANSLQAYGLYFDALNRLNEHGLVISDYNSWFDYRPSIAIKLDDPSLLVRIPFRFQNRFWILEPINRREPDKEFKLNGVALTRSGRELSSVIGLETMEEFTQALFSFFEREKLRMTEAASPNLEVLLNYP